MRSQFNTSKNPSHTRHTGILLINSGSPQAPTSSALREFLAEFLSDPRVIQWPKWLWLPLLHLVILRIRPRKVAPKYQEIWTEHGSPLLITSSAIATKLESALQEKGANSVSVRIGMRYGQLSILDGLSALRDEGVERVLLLPLFPQYSAVTAASAFDMAFQELRQWTRMPQLHVISGYHRHDGYHGALTTSIEEFISAHGQPDRLLFSYHGIPRSYAQKGDPYGEYCLETTKLVVERLGNSKLNYQTAFQSRFGPEEWLQPYTDVLLEEWGKDGVGRVYVVCPGFSADCLETLHEIDIEGRQLYQKNGAQEFRYIPALNDDRSHVQALVEIVQPFL